MTRKGAEALLRKGAEGISEWNAARARGEKIPDLHQVNLRTCDLRHAVLSKLNLCEADLRGADLRDARLSGSNLVRARLCAADLTRAQLAYSDVCRADLGGAKVARASFVHAAFQHTLIAGDYSDAIGLDSAIHYGPSNVTLATILGFREDLPERFLVGCGVPPDFIGIVRAYLGIEKKAYHSCFISYSSNDEEFARKLHERLEQSALKVWFAPEDIKWGMKLAEQIASAVEDYDKLLLVISEASLESGWVQTELRKALKAESRGHQRKLFPIRLVELAAINSRECIDTLSGRDLFVELTEYPIPDFSRWQEPGQFETAFTRLLSDLRIGEPAK
jgi:hypothetical protein